MINLTETESTNRWIQHRTWTRTKETSLGVSALQNQFALAEYELEEATALQLFRSWLWQEMQHSHGVVWREMSWLVNAAERGEEVEVKVAKGAGHGAIIVRALLWMLEKTHELPIPKATSSREGITIDDEISDGVLSTQAPIDPKHIVWMTGNTQSRIGVLSEWEKVFIPEYGVIRLQNFRWVNRSLATSPQFQDLLATHLDMAFIEEADRTPVEYNPTTASDPQDRLDQGQWFWQQADDEARLSETLAALPVTASQGLIDMLAQETESVAAVVNVATWEDPDRESYFKRPPNNTKEFGENVRPAYLQTGPDSPLKVRTPDQQQQDDRWHYADRADVEAYRQTFVDVESKLVSKRPSVTSHSSLPEKVQRAIDKTPYAAKNLNQEGING